MKIIAAIPAYNEEPFIGDIVSRAKCYVNQVIVVDDGSKDDTAKIATETEGLVVRHDTNQGTGSATRTCFKAARERDADILITLDGDGQHNPDEIPILLAPILRSEADLVIGSRFLKAIPSITHHASHITSHIPPYRRFGISVITFLFNLGSKVKVTDSQSCFRAHTRKLLETINITQNGFGFSVEVLLQARNQGFIIKEVPISCIYHPHSHSLNPVIHGLSVAFTVVKLRLKYFLHQPTRKESKCSS